MSPKVLVLGLPRTGTQSLADALVALGFKNVYHMREVGVNNHVAAWIELLDRKFGEEKQPILKADFERILSGYEAVADFPASIFASELIEAYPDAKVILLVREEDAWYKSMLSTVWHQYSHHDPNKRSKMRPLAERYNKYCWADDFPANGRQYFREYYDQVRQMAPGSDAFFEYDVKTGWKVCDFLGVPRPEEPFPRSDDWLEYKMSIQRTQAEGDA